jgi:UDP-N-acetylglucosamine:LPS N-acetylglucosamine transferase
MVARDRILDFMHKLTATRLEAFKMGLIGLTSCYGIAFWWFIDISMYDLLGKLDNKASSEVAPSKPRGLRAYKKVEVLFHILEKILAWAVMQVYGKRLDRSGLAGCPKIIFTAQDVEWRTIRDQETGEIKKSDAFFDSIIKKLADRCELVGVYPLQYSKDRVAFRALIRGLSVLIDKLRRWYVIQKPFELYWTLDSSRAEKRSAKHFRKVWSFLASDRRFQRACIYDGKDIRDQLESRLEYHFHFTFPRVVRYVEMAKHMIRKERPNLIIVINEYGSFERALIAAAKQLGVPTLAIQHGIIYSKHKAYVYYKNEISPDGSAKSPYCPIPDKTAVYGPFYKDFLTKRSAYPESTIVVTGQPRYDRLCHLEELYSRERFLRSHRIDRGHKVILWTTQCHGLSMQENERNFRIVLEVVGALKNVTLVIKQHPGEGPNYTRMIASYLAEYRANAILAPGYSDTYEQLYVCDLLISKSSTTMTEAVALSKPVILLNLTDDPTPAGSAHYVDEGVAAEVRKEDELGPAIAKLLVKGRQSGRNQRRFVEKYLYKLDGKATDRVVNLALEMVRNPNNRGHSSS